MIYNRLETDATNGLLQIDATVNYALGRDLGLGLTTEDLQVDSPYNTRTLPRAPARADRVARRRGDRGRGRTRTEGDWVYYVTVNLDTGETKFTDDYDEFLQYKHGARGLVRRLGPLLTPCPRPRRCAVLGSPIEHSLSPVLHRAAYAELGLDWAYDAVEVDGGRAAGVPRRARRVVARAVADDAAEAGRGAAARRARPTGGAGRRGQHRGARGRAPRVGHNTDVPGAAAALRERWDGRVDSAAVLGGGATAASVLLALADLGCTAATLLVRDPARAAETVAAVARHPRSAARSTVGLAAEIEPGGGRRPRLDRARRGRAGPGAAAGSDRPARYSRCVYDPWPTPLAAAGARGRACRSSAGSTCSCTRRRCRSS